MAEPTARENYIAALQALEAQQGTAILALDTVLQSTTASALIEELQTALAQAVPSGEVENVIQNTIGCLQNLRQYINNKVAVMPAVESP